METATIDSHIEDEVELCLDLFCPTWDGTHPPLGVAATAQESHLQTDKGSQKHQNQDVRLETDGVHRRHNTINYPAHATESAK